MRFIFDNNIYDIYYLNNYISILFTIDLYNNNIINDIKNNNNMIE